MQELSLDAEDLCQSKSLLRLSWISMLVATLSLQCLTAAAPILCRPVSTSQIPLEDEATLSN